MSEDFMANVGPVVRSFFDEAGLRDMVPPDGIDEIVGALAQLAGDAVRAVRTGITFDLAVRYEEDYPHLAKLHAQIEYLYTTGLREPDLAGYIEDLLDSGVADALGQNLVSLLLAWACDGSRSEMERALAEFLAFESAYATVVVSSLMTGGGFYALGGTHRHMEVGATEAVRSMLADQRQAIEHLRPADIMGLRASLISGGDLALFCEQLADLKDQCDVAVELRRAEVRGVLERYTCRADAADMIIVRNHSQPWFGEPRRKIAHLVRTHPIAFRDRNEAWARQRKKRLSERLVKRGLAGIPPRRHPALVDMLAEHLAESLQEDEQ